MAGVGARYGLVLRGRLRSSDLTGTGRSPAFGGCRPLFDDHDPARRSRFEASLTSSVIVDWFSLLSPRPNPRHGTRSQSAVRRRSIEAVTPDRPRPRADPGCGCAAPIAAAPAGRPRSDVSHDLLAAANTHRHGAPRHETGRLEFARPLSGPKSLLMVILGQERCSRSRVGAGTGPPRFGATCHRQPNFIGVLPPRNLPRDAIVLPRA